MPVAGRGIGQTDTELGFEELTDPQGITFWPEPIGRDNTRTPMVWDDGINAGFSAVRPWLPVKPPQQSRNVASQRGVAGSVLEFYRAMLAFRRATPDLITGKTRFLDLPEPVLGFMRGDLACYFNLSPTTVSVAAGGAMVGPSIASLKDGELTLGPNGFAFIK